LADNRDIGRRNHTCTKPVLLNNGEQENRQQPKKASLKEEKAAGIFSGF
jgi:hypothetical protein